MQIRESAEMYLETILVLSKKGAVRSIDIAKEMNFSRPSVSVTVHNLEAEDYINIDERGNITLLEKGREIAERIYERHTVLSEILKCIGVSEETAVNDACKMEHIISKETFDCIKKYVANAKKSQEG